MKEALFEKLVIALEIGYEVGFKKKTALRKGIVDEGGTISYIVSKKCNFVIISDPEKCSTSNKCRMALKYGLPVLNWDYIWDCLDAGKLLPNSPYIVGGKSQLLDFKCGKISAPQPEEKTNKTKAAFNPRSVKIWFLHDINLPFFKEEGFLVAKYAIFEGILSNQRTEKLFVIEIHVSSPLPNEDEEKEQDSALTGDRYKYRVVSQARLKSSIGTGDAEVQEIRYTRTSDQALSVFAMLCEDLGKQLKVSKCTQPVRGVGSTQLQKLLVQTPNLHEKCDEDVKDLVEHIWSEAMSEVTFWLGDITKIKLEQVEKAEAILLKLRDALRKSEPLTDLVNSFYDTLPYKMKEPPADKELKRWLGKQKDICQLVKDLISVNEMTNFEKRAYVEAKYAALRCGIKKSDRDEQIRDLVQSSLTEDFKMDVVNVYEIWRQTEDLDFQHDMDNKQFLFHSSKVENFVGILSRGLLLPKIVVDDYGGERSDVGLLGSGIYFASQAITSARYSTPSKTKGTRLLLVNEVALGNCKTYVKYEPTLTSAPEGYNSTHGVGKEFTKHSAFTEDQYAVYETTQQRLCYLVEFTLKDDRVKDLEVISEPIDMEMQEDGNQTDLNLMDVTDISDPMSKVKPGLIADGDQMVELKAVHITAKVVDLATQVVVLQKYVNNGSTPIEAKYVFPLDDAGAVCGFEAFINGKHIVGEVKEKETAHKEYKKAISEGHGAYLMDQDEETPDVFTVSVGNLPPKACVLIKITYIAEVQVEGELISFRLPATVAPWKESSALKDSTQEELKSHKVVTNHTTIQVSIEMPFDIRSLQCTTHRVNIKQTVTKAFVELVKGEEFGAGFQLLIGLAEIHVPRMWVENLPDDPYHQACMLTFHPEFEVSAIEKGEIIVALDCSNSMKGEALLEAKKVALLLLKQIPPQWSFNVLTFGSDFEELFPAPKTKTDQNMDRAWHFIQNSSATLGNTDIGRPLHSYFLLPKSDNTLRNVFLVSDGHINNTDGVLRNASKNVSHTRIFTFGVSSTCNGYFLKALARVSGGAYEFFNKATKSKWEPKVKGQIHKASQPGLTSVSVEWVQYDDNLPTPTQAPCQITALFNGFRQVVYGFVPNCTMAKLVAKIGGQEVSTIVSTSELSITEGLIVHRLTARAVIRDWEYGMLSSDRTNHEIAKMDLKNVVIELSKKYSIVTQFTSFIAVEKRDENEKDLTPSGPSMDELVKNENVDILHYMGWTKLTKPAKRFTDDVVAEVIALESYEQQGEATKADNERILRELGQLNGTAGPLSLEDLDIPIDLCMEISEAISAQIGDSMLDDDDELEEELEMLLAQAEEVTDEDVDEEEDEVKEYEGGEEEVTDEDMDEEEDEVEEYEGGEEEEMGFALFDDVEEIYYQIPQPARALKAPQKKIATKGAPSAKPLPMSKKVHGGLATFGRHDDLDSECDESSSDEEESQYVDMCEEGVIDSSMFGEANETSRNQDLASFSIPMLDTKASPLSASRSSLTEGLPDSPIQPSPVNDKSEPPVSGFSFGGSSQQGGLFGSAQPQQGGLFGTAQPQQGGLFGSAQSQKSLSFGSAQTAQEGSLRSTQTQQGFGFGSAQPQQEGLFGSAQPQQGGLFGSAQPQQGGLFGSAPPQQGGLFGTEQSKKSLSFGSAQTAQEGSLRSTQTQQGFGFGSAQPQQEGLFGSAQLQQGGLFGSAQPQQGGLFGSAPPQQGGLFGTEQSKKSLSFGSAQTAQEGSLRSTQTQQGFGFGSAQPQQEGLFGSAQLQQGGLFGSAQPQQEGLFGSAQSQKSLSFGSAQTAQEGSLRSTQTQQGFGFGSAQPQQEGLFGSAQPQQGGLFGSAQPQQGGLFGSAQPQQGGLFGSAQSQKSLSFGSAQTAQEGSLRSTQTQQGFGFGSAQPQQGGLFGSAQPQQGGLFGSAQPQQGGLFGSAQSQKGIAFGPAQTQQSGFGSAQSQKICNDPVPNLARGKLQTSLANVQSPTSPSYSPTSPSYSPITPSVASSLYAAQTAYIEPLELPFSLSQPPPRSFTHSLPRGGPPPPPGPPPPSSSFAPPPPPPPGGLPPPPPPLSSFAPPSPSPSPKPSGLVTPSFFSRVASSDCASRNKQGEERQSSPLPQRSHRQLRSAYAPASIHADNRDLLRTGLNIEIERKTKQSDRQRSRDRECLDRVAHDDKEEGRKEFPMTMRDIMLKKAKKKKAVSTYLSTESLTLEVELVTSISPVACYGIGSRLTKVRETGTCLKMEQMDKLMSSQSHTGHWELNAQLGDLIGVDIDACIKILMDSGIMSLGQTAMTELQRLVATMMAILSIVEIILPQIIPIDKAHIETQITQHVLPLRNSGTKEERVGRCLGDGVLYCVQTDKAYPLTYSTLELGPDWLTICTAMLGIPMKESVV